MVVQSQLEAQNQRLAIVSTETKFKHPVHTTIIEVDESLFWLQTSVQAFWQHNRGPQLAG